MDSVKRGSLVTVALQVDFGKPRPAVVIQSDFFADTATVTVLPLSSSLMRAPMLRVDVQSEPANSLRKISQVMVDKPLTVRRDKVGKAVGQLGAAEMVEVDRRLAVFLGIAK